MSIVAKFFVSEIGQTTYGGRVRLNVVCRGEENKHWASATPSGQIEMTIRNDLALGEFLAPGEEFLVTFEHAPKE